MEKVTMDGLLDCTEVTLIFHSQEPITTDKKTSFFEAWTSDNTIGLLYNADAKTLSCFHNKKYVGTPFRDVEG